MMHFFIRSKIHVDCFTYRKSIVEHSPIVPAIKVIPKWWKDLPKQRYVDNNFFPVPTMKKCAGLIDYYTNSIAMPLWSDLAINITPGGHYEWQFSDNTSVAMVHSEKQYSGFIDNKPYGQLKLSSPWVFSTKKSINWLLTQPVYNEPNFFNYVTVNGILNFYHQTQTNIQLFINTETPKVFTLNFGTPFLFTPMSDKKVVIHRHLVSKEEYISRENTTGIKFTDIYTARKRTEKCPFHNHMESK
jgi:hypothetical protein